jgi:hypothetical protein
LEIKSQIVFADERLHEAYLKLENSTSEEAKLKEWLDTAFERLEENALCGTQIPKRLIPKEYVAKYSVKNLWKYDLPGAWRLMYTIGKEGIVVLSVVLEWLTHKDYEHRFKY